MTTFIYMAEDNKYAPILNADSLVLFKAGYSKDPVRRGGQLKQAARRDHIAIAVNMRVKHHIIEIPKQYAHIVEAYILHRVGLMPTAQPLSREFFMLSIADRQRCYDNMAQWVTEALISIQKNK